MSSGETKKKWGGARPGGGRPRGAMNKKSLDKMKVKARLDQHYLRASRVLANAQLHIATGQTFLYKIEKEWIKTGVNKKTGEENGYWRNKKPKLVESQDEIESYLMSLADEANGDMDDEKDPGATYFYMTAKEPSNDAIKDIMNRVHGMPKATVDNNINVQFSLKDLAQRREALKVPNKLIDEVETKAPDGSLRGRAV